MKAIVFVAVLALSFVAVHSEIWAVLVAGSDGWWNYRHQSDICHAYQILVKGGVKADNIIVFAKDDIANNPSNPVKGKVYNKKMSPGYDVYAGCKIDYAGKEVTVKNYLAVLKGDEATVHGHGTGRVVKSTSQDTVFLDYSDHGSTGLICFPSEYLYKDQLQQALFYMYEHQMYKKLVYYLEACESGSMFVGYPTNKMIYTTTASNPTESSWAFYCPPNDDVVDGKHIGACLGDEYSIQWMEDTENHDSEVETLQDQYENTKKATLKSHVCQYGDLTWTTDKVSSILGIHKPKARTVSDEEITAVPSRDAKLVSLQALAAKNDKAAMIALEKEFHERKFYDDSFDHLGRKFGNLQQVNGDGETDFNCYREIVNHWENSCGKFSDYGIQFAKFFYNFCKISPDKEELKSAITALC